MNLCETCAHWRPWAGRNHQIGDCVLFELPHKPGAKLAVLHAFSPVDLTVTTRQDFGCVQHATIPLTTA